MGEYPTYRLDARCPDCGAHLRVRRRRADHERFLSCSRFPRCRWAGDYDSALQRLAADRDELEAALDAAIAELRERRGWQAVPDLARELRNVIALAHPDRWDAHPLAHEVTARLTDLRRRVAA